MALSLSRDNLAYLEDVNGLYNQESCLASIETTLIDHTVPLGETHVLMSITVGGNDRGQFIIKINGSEKLRVRNAWTDRTKEHSLGDRKIFEGDNVIVSVLNDGSISNFFEAKLNVKKL